ncbi:Acetyl-CoA-benzylalcohol acetyltransferase [Bertholletia excelsa]
MKTEISSRKLIKPSSPTPNHPPTCSISFFDQLAPPIHVPLLYFYPADSTKTVDKIQRLEQSLSEVLTVFYPQAGRYHKDDLLVDCNDQGAEFVEATVDLNLSEFLEEGPKVDLLRSFVPWAVGTPIDATIPMLAVQVTIFTCGGIVLCVYNSHVIADGFTGTKLIHTWATFCRIGVAKVELPNFCLPELFPARDLSEVIGFPATTEGGPPPKVITRRLLFHAEKITALKARAGGEPGDVLIPTRLEVVLATVWKALIRVSQATHQGQLRPSLMAISVNLRGRTALPTPENAAGNFYVVTAAKFPGEEDKTDLNHMVGFIRDSIKKTLASYADLSTADEIFSAVVRDTNEMRRALHDEEVDVHHMTSLCGFPIYETDFGWGKPLLVSNVSVPLGLTALIDEKDGRGIEAWVSLKEPCLSKFEKDPDIAAVIGCSPN